jgi:hypothetical protein
MIVGQDWDLFSPVTTYTFDYVGLYFMAGNVGFMRQQFQFLHDSGDWEFGAAVGMAGNNPGVTDNDLEAGKSPTYSLRATRKLTNGRIGLSGIYARLAYNTDNGDARDFTTDAYGANAFYEQTMENGWAVKSELYYGQNLNNIGALSIGKGTATSNVKEYGGTLTATKKVSEKGMMFGGAGLAKADEKGQVTPLAITNNVITAPGVTSNFLSRIGYDHAITKDFSWLTEASRYETESRISASKYQVNIAYSLETGFVLRF